jgi:hypothetical protein
MIPFMGAQSAVLGYEFGLAYETGKRTIKAMPNDLFNKIVAGSDEQINVVYDGQEYNMKYSDYIDFLVKKFHSSKIDEFREHLPDYMALQNTLIDKTVEIEVAKANRTPSAFREIFEGFTGGFTEQQKEDLGNFFGTFTDSFSRLLGWFGLQSGTTNNDPTDINNPNRLEIYTSFSFDWYREDIDQTLNHTTDSLTYYGHQNVIDTERAKGQPINIAFADAYQNALNAMYNITSS